MIVQHKAESFGKKVKFTTVEKRAQLYCDRIKKYSCETIKIEWKKSKTYGSNPVIFYGDQKCTNVSGCGFDKLSTALADLLAFLVTPLSNEYWNIRSKGVCGVSSLENELMKYDWKLEKVANGSDFDVYHIEKI